MTLTSTVLRTRSPLTCTNAATAWNHLRAFLWLGEALTFTPPTNTSMSFLYSAMWFPLMVTWVPTYATVTGKIEFTRGNSTSKFEPFTETPAMLKVLSLPVQSTSITKPCSPSSTMSTEPSKSHDLGAWSSAKNVSDPLAGLASVGVCAVSAQLIGAIGADFTSKLRELRAFHAMRASEQ